MSPVVFSELLEAGIVVLGISLVALNAARADRRRNEIQAKYGDTLLALRILHRGIWTGQSAEELRDSWGISPHIDRMTQDPKSKEIWKYAPQGGGHFGLKVTLENDVVVEWEVL